MWCDACCCCLFIYFYFFFGVFLPRIGFLLFRSHPMTWVFLCRLAPHAIVYCRHHSQFATYKHIHTHTLKLLHNLVATAIKKKVKQIRSARVFFCSFSSEIRKRLSGIRCLVHVLVEYVFCVVDIYEMFVLLMQSSVTRNLSRIVMPFALSSSYSFVDQLKFRSKFLCSRICIKSNDELQRKWFMDRQKMYKQST